MLNRKMLPSQFTFIGYAIGPTVYLFLAALSGLNPGTYDWDELVYLARSKDLSQGFFYQSGDYWGDYRAPGLSALLRIFASILGYDENRLVVLPIILGLISVLFVGYIAKELAGRTASIVAMGTLPVLPYFVLTNSGFYADTAGTAFSLLTVAAAMYFAKQEKFRAIPFLLALILLGAISTYMRYGAVFTIVPLLLGIFLTQYFQKSTFERAVYLKRWTTFSFSIGIGTLLIYLNPYITLLGDSPAEANSALTADREDLSVSIFIRGFVELSALWFRSRSTLETVWLGSLAVLLFVLAVFVIFSRKTSTFASFRNSYIWLFSFLLQLTLLATQVGLMSKNYFLIFTPTVAILFGLFAAELSVLNLTRRLSKNRKFLALVLTISFLLSSLVIANRTLENKKASNIDVYRSALIEIEKASGDTKCNVLSNVAPTIVWLSRCNGIGWNSYGTGWDFSKNPEKSRTEIANTGWEKTDLANARAEIANDIFFNPSRTWQANISGNYFFIVSTITRRQPPIELLEQVLRLKDSEVVTSISDPNRKNDLIFGEFYE